MHEYKKFWKELIRLFSLRYLAVLYQLLVFMNSVLSLPVSCSRFLHVLHNTA
jgi:hypothetical protein